jgi:hypothetical protein
MSTRTRTIPRSLLSARRTRYLRLPLFFALSCLLAILTLASTTTPASAQTAASAISQAFQTDQKDITVGSLVSLNKAKSNKVTLASTDNLDDLVGVVASTSLVEIGQATSAQDAGTTEVQVVTNGVTDALVSDINGAVKIGDKITPSPIRGVGMKLTSNAQIVGVTQGNFADVTETTTQEVTSKDGTKSSVKIGRVPVRVSIGFYSGNPTNESSKPSTPLIQRLANAIAGRETSTIRIAISFVLLLMGFAVMIILLRTAVASSLTSIGRNPLSADAIHKNFNGVALIALGILLVALAAAYLALVL